MFELSKWQCKRLHVNMITSLARDKHKHILIIGLIAMIIISGQVVSLTGAMIQPGMRDNGGGVDDDQWEMSAPNTGTASVDNEWLERQSASMMAPDDARELLALLAVRNFCSRHPTKCDQSDQLDRGNQELFGPGYDDIYENHISRRRRYGPTGSGRTTNQLNSRLARMGHNMTGGDTNGPVRGDELDWLGTWNLSNNRIRYTIGAAPGAGARPGPGPGPGPGKVINQPGGGRHTVATRSWRQLGLRTGPNTYRVSLDEARRFIRAQQKGQASYEMGTMAPSLLYAQSRLASDLSERHGQQQFNNNNNNNNLISRPAAMATGLSEPITRSRAPVTIREQRSSSGDGDGGGTPIGQQIPLAVPKRTELLPENPFSTNTPVTSIKYAEETSRPEITTSNHQLGQENVGLGGEDKSRDVMQCNLRHYTYRATKADGRGNTCTGLVNASICYGGCDSGEIADWLFPYKKSIHKVCRHGGRVRRRVLLAECHSAGESNTNNGQGQGQGLSLSLSETSFDDSLREYYYVDARDCICKKCTGIDTNCLGTMTQPHLQTLGETVAELSAINGD